MPSLLELMPKAEREKAIENGRKRIERQRAKKGRDVSPEIFLVAKAGIYWGWDAMMAIRRGYTLEHVVDNRGELVLDSSGRPKLMKSTLTLEEVQLLLDGADKVRYSQLVEETHAGVISQSFKSSSKSFDGALEPFKEKAKVTE